MQDCRWPLEDFPMTFQIGLVGADGVLLASDLLYASRDEITGVWTTFKAGKIEITPDGKLAYCCAGGAWSDSVIKAFLGTKIHPIRDNLILSGQLTWQHAGKERENPFWKGSILLVERGEGAITLWHMNSNLPVNALRILDKKTQGDDGNVAQFFLERYFKGGQNIKQLVPLAAFSVLMANKINPSGIDGLEMLLCTTSGFSVVGAEELTQNKETFERLDSDIGARLLPFSPP